MLHLNEIGIELKSGIFFSFTALILSIIAGFAGNVPGSMILFRSLIIIPFFFGIGFGIIIIMKRFVPEVYEVLSNIKLSKDETQQDEINIDTISADEVESSEKPDQEFSEFTEKDYDRLQTVNDSGLNSSLNSSDGKLGRHVIIENEMSGYEPKIMAQAIRTMMSKDKD